MMLSTVEPFWPAPSGSSATEETEVASSPGKVDLSESLSVASGPGAAVA
eukprot:CAMPEP_0168486636 /NCGR_PEP_ID=MMETSP0228-20121227/67223_1 /TAXON_ID=133427 /ORGANISM="Protoceratium reticulatum, Strain CCCM 535 (=CCMP 1889)" /LENGTH=48 /DNA_ID= /DNA_START= /DNA_END= /DNA_ORIENTATION=